MMTVANENLDDTKEVCPMLRTLKWLCFLLVIITGCAVTQQGTRIAQEPTSSSRLVHFLSGSPAIRGRTAPDAVLRNLEGREVHLKAVLDAVPDKETGKQPTILLFSSITCPYSVQEHIEVQSAMKTLKKRAKAVTVLVNETPQSAREYLRGNHVPGTVLLDPEATAARAYKIEMVPTLLLVSSAGKVNQYRHFTLARDVVNLMAQLRRVEERTGGYAPRRG